MTYSIIARDQHAGTVGIAVASRFFAVGALVPFVGRCTAIASQAYLNPLWGIEGKQRLEAGETAQTVLTDLAAHDAGKARRQAHAIGLDGLIAAHTGGECDAWCGHIMADNISLAGNMLTGPEVLEDALAAYQANHDLPFADRLLLAMEAGERAGGDKRGRQSAAIIIHKGQDYPWLDIRADDHADPLAELRRLLRVSEERFQAAVETLPKAGEFPASGS